MFVCLLAFNNVLGGFIYIVSALCFSLSPRFILSLYFHRYTNLLILSLFFHFSTFSSCVSHFLVSNFQHCLHEFLKLRLFQIKPNCYRCWSKDVLWPWLSLPPTWQEIERFRVRIQSVIMSISLDIVNTYYRTKY